jgi:hypothetical protein
MASLEARIGYALVEDLIARAVNAKREGDCPPLGRRCHSVVRAIARVLPLMPYAPEMRVVDGGFYAIAHDDPDWAPPSMHDARAIRMAHSWLAVGGAILDPYPLCAATGPVLVPPPDEANGRYSMLWYGYRGGERHFDASARAKVESPEFAAEVDALVAWFQPHAPLVRIEDLITGVALPCDLPVQPS